MKKKTKKDEPVYGNFPPPTNCSVCGGRGEIKDQYVAGGLFGPSSHWTYRKCTSCNGTGRNLWTCIWCKGSVTDGGDFWCANEKCEKYAVKVALALKGK